MSTTCYFCKKSVDDIKQHLIIHHFKCEKCNKWSDFVCRKCSKSVVTFQPESLPSNDKKRKITDIGRGEVESFRYHKNSSSPYPIFVKKAKTN